MRLTNVSLPGFGCLSGFSCELSEGLNVFYGENEAGKSTLQQAISALLYGFFDNERALKDETARHERFRPWARGVYRGSLGYELEDGRRFEVRRDFSTTDVITQIIDSAMGIDVSPQFGRGRHGNVPFARKHLGMSRGVFQSCAFISQGEIFDMQKNASPSEIGDAIAALADSARRDVSAAKAIDRLDATLGRIGSDRARTADLPVAREKMGIAKAELQSADLARQGVAEKAARLEGLQTKARKLAEEALRGEYLLERAEAVRMRAQVARVSEAEVTLRESSARRDALSRYASLTTGLRDEVITLNGQMERAREGVARLAAQRDDSAGELTGDDRLEYETLRLSVGQLSAEQVGSLQEQAYQRPPATGMAAVVTAIVRAVGAAVRAVARFVLRRPFAEAPVGTPVVAPAEALVLLERHRRYLTLRPVVERLDTIERQLGAERSGLAGIEARLAAALRAVGIEESETGAGFAAFEVAWRGHEEYKHAMSQAEEAQKQRELLLNGQTIEDLIAQLEEHEDAASRLAKEHPQLRECKSSQSPEQLARTLQTVREEFHGAELQGNTLGEEVRLTLERYRARAEVEEEVAHWTREVVRLERARAAATLAKTAIQEAMTNVYRDFAPAVNSFLSEGIEIATEGRYRRAHVDPASLRVSLLVPETDQVMTDPPVSHGTRTLMYVLMRIGLAQHMSAIGEPVPLVLDDPFVDVDSARLRRMLDFLLALSDRMQILLFTKDREVAEWLETRSAGQHRVHRLSTVLAARV